MCIFLIAFNSCDKENELGTNKEFNQEVLQESYEFKTFMNLQTGWYLKHVFARLNNKIAPSQEEVLSFKSELFTNGILDLDSEAFINFMTYFNFDEPSLFADYYNKYNEARIALISKYPQINSNKNIFIKAQKEYLSNLDVANLIMKDLSQRNDEPEGVVQFIEMPKCHWSAYYLQTGNSCLGLVPILEVRDTNEDNPDFSNCTNYIENNCQAFYNECVIRRQFQFISDLMACFGEEFIYFDVEDILDGECYWTFAQEGEDSEYICPENELGTGGIDIVISLLEGFMDSGGTCFDCIVNDYFSVVCVACGNETRSLCCD